MSNDLGQNGTLEQTSHSKNLSLSLPIDQWNGHLTCVVSNPADQKNATLDLRGICPQKGECEVQARVKKMLVRECNVVGSGAQGQGWEDSRK